MTSLKQLEDMQQQFNMVVECARDYMSALFDDDPKGGFARGDFYNKKHPKTLYDNYSKLLKLMQVKVEKLPTHQLDSDLGPKLVVSVHEDFQSFNEARFVSYLNGLFCGQYRLNFLMSYTGTKPRNPEIHNEKLPSIYPEKVSGWHEKNLRLDHPEFTILLNKIDLLRLYGCTKGYSMQSASGPGLHAINIADGLYKTVESHLNGEKTPQGTAQKIEGLLAKGHKLLGHDRNATDILAHIALACTGIGLIVMFVNWSITGSFFLNKTNRQVIAEQIATESNKILIPGQ